MNNDAAGSKLNTTEKKKTTLPMMFTNYAKATSGKTPTTLLEYSEIVSEQLGKQYTNKVTNSVDNAAHPHKFI